MKKNKEYLLLLYLFQSPDLKEIDIYKLLKTMINLRIVADTYTKGIQNKN